MEISQIAFLYLFVYSFISGAVLGVVYDVVYMIRWLAMLALTPEKVRSVNLFGKRFGLPNISNAEFGDNKKRADNIKRLADTVLRVLTVLLDIIFMIVCGLGIVIIAYAYNSGKLRWIIFAGELLGFLLYRLSVSRIIICAAKTTAFLIISASAKLFHLINLPIKKSIFFVKSHIKIRINKKDPSEK